MLRQDLGWIPSLNELKPGDVLLKVPVENDAVQMNRFDSPPQNGRLTVMVAGETIDVTRQDGAPLQLQVHYREWDGTQEVPASRFVLGEPVQVLTLRRRPLRRGLWDIDQVELTRDNKADLRTFAQLIGVHALTSQLRAANRRRNP